jgi:hypothetical protein
MVHTVLVDRDRHGRKRWRRPNGYGFAANLAVAPLGGSEFSQAIAMFPIGFIEGSPGSYMPVAVLALSKGGSTQPRPVASNHPHLGVFRLMLKNAKRASLA